MIDTWRQRLQKIIDETPGLTMKGIALKAGLSASTLHNILKRGATPSVDHFLEICRVVGVGPAELLTGISEPRLQIPIVGIVDADERWSPVDPGGRGVGFDVGSHDTIGIEVRGDAMAPVYRDGDFLVCYRQFGPHADNCIGLDCVVRTAAGDHFVKILKRGTRPNRFNLKSYNPVADDIEDVAIAWAAPVAWIKRGTR